VEAGETFFGIARRYGLTAAALRAANPDARWESVRIGEELRIPPAPRTAATPTRPGAGGRTASGRRTATARRVHVVERGETLFGIARRYNVRARQIQDANDMRGDQVRIGQRLVIPAP
jgi:N-acetylmuramoyl-L-alanine amidase